MYKEEYEAVPLSYASSGWRLDATRLTLEVVEAKFCNQLYRSSTRLYVSCPAQFFRALWLGARPVPGKIVFGLQGICVPGLRIIYTDLNGEHKGAPIPHHFLEVTNSESLQHIPFTLILHSTCFQNGSHSTGTREPHPRCRFQQSNAQGFVQCSRRFQRNDEERQGRTKSRCRRILQALGQQGSERRDP